MRTIAPEQRGVRRFGTLAGQIRNQIDAIVKANGVMDLGMTTQQYSEMRTKMFPRFQDMWGDKQSPADALAQYEKEVNEVLSR